ncbi:hypothetical protein CHS0354_038860, partial [Potamilus streckersoni]
SAISETEPTEIAFCDCDQNGFLLEKSSINSAKKNPYPQCNVTLEKVVLLIISFFGCLVEKSVELITKPYSNKECGYTFNG